MIRRRSFLEICIVAVVVESAPALGIHVLLQVSLLPLESMSTSTSVVVMGEETTGAGADDDIMVEGRWL